MKKIGISLILLVIIIVTALFYGKQNKIVRYEYFRMHVRANSNDVADQRIKYEIKDKLVEFLTPYVAECKTKEQAVNVISNLTESMNRICDSYLKAKGFDYTAKTEIRNEYFPTRVYGEETLESGYYDSIIVELGTGKGDNWWCVVYPPLCFVNNNSSVKYRSKIIEIINNFK